VHAHNIQVVLAISLDLVDLVPRVPKRTTTIIVALEDFLEA
jgi:hypothetical protein